jgi:peptidoglycan-associated lipoprotein
MYARLIGIVGAVILLAACSSAPETPAGGPGGPGGPGGGAMGAPMGGVAGAAVPGSQQDLAQTAGDRVFFAFDRSDISPEAQQTLQRQAEWLQRYPNVTVTIEGHCDERGTREYNLALGERRANAAKQVLIAAGVAPSRISTISYGKDRPVVPGSTEEAWAQNRVAITTVN